MVERFVAVLASDNGVGLIRVFACRIICGSAARLGRRSCLCIEPLEKDGVADVERFGGTCFLREDSNGFFGNGSLGGFFPDVVVECSALDDGIETVCVGLGRGALRDLIG